MFGTTSTAREIITEFAPDAKFAGPTTCRTDVAFIANVLKAGGDKYLDLVTEHPYRAAAEMPDYYTDLQNLNAICARYGNKPHWATECGSRSEEMMTDNRITPYIRSSVAANLRMMLTAYAGGAEVYTLFSFWHWGGASSWQLTTTGATGKLYEYVPQPVLYGLRTIVNTSVICSTMETNASPSSGNGMALRSASGRERNSREVFTISWAIRFQKSLRSGNRRSISGQNLRQMI